VINRKATIVITLTADVAHYRCSTARLSQMERRFVQKKRTAMFEIAQRRIPAIEKLVQE
jgi:hypothetical protein